MEAYCFVEPKSTGKISDEMALLAVSSSASSSSSASATTLPEFAETHIKTLVDCEFEEIFKEHVFTVEELNAISELLVPSVTRSVEEDRKQQLLQKQARALCVKLGSQIPELLARPIGLSNTLSEHHASTALIAFKRHLAALLVKLREMQVVAPVAVIQQAPVTVAPSAVHFSPAPSFPAVPDHDLPVEDKSKMKVLA